MLNIMLAIVYTTTTTTTTTMSSAVPPSPYFSNIQYNPSLFTGASSSITLDYANDNYLRRTGGASSIAASTSFTGTVAVLNTTVSSSVGSGCMTLAGGLGVAGQITAADTKITGNLSFDSPSTIDLVTNYKCAGTVVNSIAIGVGAGSLTSTANGVVALGNNACAGITTAGALGCIGIGTNAARVFPGSNLSSGNGIVAIGDNSLQSSTSINNTAIGSSALSSLTLGTANVAIGRGAAKAVTGLASSSRNNVIIGDSAALAATVLTNCTVIGTSCAINTSTLVNTVAIGNNTLIGIVSGADRNVAIGTNCAISLTSGDDNCIIGYQAANALTTGNFNIGIGSGITFASATGSSQLNIGGALTGDLVSGNLAVLGGLTVNGPLNVKSYTVALLPVGVQGDRAFATDASGPTFGSAVVGGGAVFIPVFKNATVWACG